MSDLKTLIEGMPAKFNADAAGDMEEIFQFNITDGDSYYLTIKGGNCTIDQGESDSASVTFVLDEATAVEVISGETNGMQAFMAGRLRVEGDMMLSTKLDSLFTLA